MSLPAATVRLLARLESAGIRLGLDAVRATLAALGDPQRRLPTVLVGGTNGKGSTAALLAAIGTAAGYRTGLYTSPHLECVEERIRVDGRAIDGRDLGALLAEVAEAARGAAEPLPTYFEALTAAALVHFARGKLDLAVLEVGLGGRLDATNASEPMLCLLTEISLEHRQLLGATVEEIAREKAGILRPAGPAIAAVEDASGRRALAAAAAEIGARLVWVDDEVEIDGPPANWRPQPIRLTTPAGVRELVLPLLGAHQRRNLALAVLAAEHLAERSWSGFDARAVRRGVERCRWPGRLELVELPAGQRVLLDVAHNPGGVATLVRFLAAVGGPYRLLFGALADKQVEAMLPPLAAAARRIVLTAPASERAAPPEELRTWVPQVVPVRIEEDPARALERALSEGDELLVVCGSTYLVGPVRRLLRERFGTPPALLDLL